MEKKASREIATRSETKKFLSWKLPVNSANNLGFGKPFPLPVDTTTYEIRWLIHQQQSFVEALYTLSHFCSIILLFSHPPSPLALPRSRPALFLCPTFSVSIQTLFSADSNPLPPPLLLERIFLRLLSEFPIAKRRKPLLIQFGRFHPAVNP